MSVTLIIIIVTCIISYMAFSRQDLVQKYLHNPYMEANRGQYYRMLTSGFLHGSLGHLAFNMLSLYFFGRVVEYIMQVEYGETTGIALYLLIYIGGIIVGSIPALIKHRDNPHYNALGASGGVSSVIFSSIIFNPVMDICLYFVLCLPGFLLGALYLIYSYVQNKRGADNIGHDAHFSGAIFGALVTIILVPGAIPRFFLQLSQWSITDLF